MPSDAIRELQADCRRCLVLCRVGPGFAASADFALDKPAGGPCVHLHADARCGIHGELPERGFPGCVAYDCFGAGQHVEGILEASLASGSHVSWDDAPPLQGRVDDVPRRGGPCGARD